MTNWTYDVNNLEFTLLIGDIEETFYADVSVSASNYLYGDDADGNRGVWVTEREINVEEVRNALGLPIESTPQMEQQIQNIIDIKGRDLE